ncbi:phospholipase/Carboxylesterase [Hirsutella rhossiliensis]|uniref:Phospholipase/Carboxylesterase domain-containing protein n=1 Tax=Hirsutella rhossiliensis TaxID=111463 RepID=A0A9P8N1N7_9HYPO|nr:phospholipase/Carboxylesterase domain-containing protein [Hirsutella rhossiliensis]KAH0964972.1 phospholipase/Carboxylesterase domain-containing protein [Hirsutella rhossiliensis]
MPPRIPTEADFAPLAATLPHTLHFPSPRESTTALLVLLHGLGDSEAPFARFARGVALPGVLAVAVRGTAPLPLLDNDDDDDGGHFHWGDDVRFDAGTGDVDADPGFGRAARAVMDGLVRGVFVERCGWEVGDVMLFGFGQGGSLALGMASQLRASPAVIDVTDSASASPNGGSGRDEAFKGVVSIGGPLPASMVPTTTARSKSTTRVLAVQLDEDQVEAIEAEFRHVTAVRWRRRDVAMPRDRDEMLPIMRFFADCLGRV